MVIFMNLAILIPPVSSSWLGRGLVWSLKRRFDPDYWLVEQKAVERNHPGEFKET